MSEKVLPLFERVDSNRAGFLFAFLVVSGSAAAQSGPVAFELSFSNPGARSLGLGGAFAALADDATAAFANPAGLVQLVRPEVSIEGRSWSYSTPFTEGGRLSGIPIGVGLDDASGLRSGVSSSEITSLSFLSFVYPQESWSLALYRHQLANYEAALETQGFFGTDRESGQPFRFSDVRTVTRFNIATYAVSGAYRVRETFSLGFGVSYFDGELASSTEVFAPIEATLPEGTFGPNLYSRDALVTTANQTIDDTAWGVHAGFLWHLTPQWNLGGFYRQGPTFTGRGTEFSGAALEPDLPEGTTLSDTGTPVGFPGVFGLGMAYKSGGGAVTASFEWDWVQYSTLIESPTPGVVDEDVRLDDGHEVHFGFEYVFLGVTPLVAVRLGTWLDPDHRIRYEGDDLLARAIFKGRADQWHFAFGLAFRSLQADLGVDLSEQVATLSFSAIVSF